MFIGDLHVRHLGPDGRRRGEAEPGRRGRAVDRPAARPARSARCSGSACWASSSCVVARRRPAIAAAQMTGGSRCRRRRRARSSMLLTLVRPRLHALLDGAGLPRRARVADGGGLERLDARSRWSATLSLLRLDPRWSPRTRTASSRTSLTFLPPSAPMVVPLRAALGAIQPWEIGAVDRAHARGDLGAVRGRRRGSTPAPCSRPAAG